MICPNCGLANPDTARFCGNCGTTLAGGSGSYTPQPPSAQPPYASGSGIPRGPQSSMGQKIGIGCLIAVVIFFVFGLSCARACFRPRRYYRRSGSLVRLVSVHAATAQLSAQVVRTPGEVRGKLAA